MFSHRRAFLRGLMTALTVSAAAATLSVATSGPASAPQNPATIALASETQPVASQLPADSLTSTIPTIGPGYSDNHAGVECIQRALNVRMDGAPYGTYGTRTNRAVQQFQTDHRPLQVDGEVGAETANALLQHTNMPESCRSVLPAAGPASNNQPAETSPGQEQRPTPRAGTERTVCREGSRHIDAPGQARELQTRFADGGRGRAEITLRWLPAENCYWGLLEGPGAIWVERVRHDDPNNPEWNLYEQVNEDDTIRHTAAALISEGDSVRACGRAFDGSWTEGSSHSEGASAGTSGASLTSSEERNYSDTYTFHDGTVCTRWAPATPPSTPQS